MRRVAWYAIIVGALMLVQWTFFLAMGQVPEFQTEPWRIAFHLVGEGATAIVLLVAGVGLHRRKSWARDLALTAFGMLIYTVIVSPGYFAQLGQWPLVVMFGLLLFLALLSVRVLMQER